MHGTTFAFSEFRIRLEEILRLSELTCRGPRALFHLLESEVIKKYSSTLIKFILIIFSEFRVLHVILISCGNPEETQRRG